MRAGVHLKGTVLPVDVWIRVGDLYAARQWIAQRYRQAWEEHDAAGVASLFKRLDDVGYEGVIWLKQWRIGDAYDIGCFAHEANHIAIRLLRTLGIEDEETHCYVLQWIIDEGAHQLNKRARKA